MSRIEITVSLPRELVEGEGGILEAFADAYNYPETVDGKDGPIENPLSKRDFLCQKLIDYIHSILANHTEKIGKKQIAKLQEEKETILRAEGIFGVNET